MSDSKWSAISKPQDATEVNAMVKNLLAHVTKARPKAGERSREDFSVSKNTYAAADGTSVDSWKMQDWDYKKDNLPSYARGLFTRRNEKSGNYEIVVRGYDKFFNVEEVVSTHWQNIMKDSVGPYELSVKENGCIIFIAALNDEQVIVCSKHATGPAKAGSSMIISHSIAAENWLKRHLASVKKTIPELAKRLKELNATAVAELCDDNFEEHVLTYTEDTAGLYLHGINLNLPEFATYPHHMVDQFAIEWGFKTTQYIVEANINKVKSFLDQVADTGAYNGRDIEGFVVRCHQKVEHGPRPNWFFKYKFEEPYLMYRQWRECIRSVIAGKKPFIKKQKAITEKFITYVRRRFLADPSLRELFNKNQGIIALRNYFLAEQNMTGAEVVRQEQEEGEEKIFLVPIAAVGCGKTTTSLALCRLFGWKQYQNDDVEEPKNRPYHFVSRVTALVEESPVVFADRNNPLQTERAQFMRDASDLVPNPIFVALYWDCKKYDKEFLLEILLSRVMARGNKHQTIQAGRDGKEKVRGIISGFLSRFQRLNSTIKGSNTDERFNLSIELDPLASIRENLDVVISQLYEHYPRFFPVEMPSDSQIDEAIDWAVHKYVPEKKIELAYKKKDKPIKQDVRGQDSAQAPAKKARKAPVLEYFSIRVPKEDVIQILKKTFKNIQSPRNKIYKKMLQSNRIQSDFHVTLAHQASSKMFPAVWAKYTSLYEAASANTSPMDNSKEFPLGYCGVVLDKLLWDERVMAFTVKLVHEDTVKWPIANKVAHITVGTVHSTIKPKESNDLISRLAAGHLTGIEELNVEDHELLDGTVYANFQK